jgi:hypothetical protein
LIVGDEPWLKRDGESEQAHGLFVEYRDLPGRLRSVARLYERRRDRGLDEPSLTRLARWRLDHEWRYRVEAYDAHLDRSVTEALVKERRDAARRHARIAVEMQAKIVARLKTIEPRELDPKDLISWLRISVEVERTALGMAEVSQVEVSGPAGGPIELTAVAAMGVADRRALLADAVATATERLDRLRLIEAPIEDP